MDVQTITMDPEIALQKFEEYRAAVRRRADAADRLLMRTYRQLAEGRQVLRLADAIAAAGVDDLHRPKLAIARADATHVTFTKEDFVHRGEQGYQHLNRYHFAPAHRWRPNYMDFPRDIFPDCPPNCDYLQHNQVQDPDDRRRLSHPYRLQAMVPLIPPHLRPSNDLAGYHILWDVKGAWKSVPPRDPMLLRQIDGDFYAVLAVWDLTAWRWPCCDWCAEVLNDGRAGRTLAGLPPGARAGERR